MTVLIGGYVGAKTCTGGPSAGAKNLMAVFLARHGAQGGKNLGIYNCRTVRGGKTTSLHGEGRAGDHGCPVGNAWMQGWCDLLIKFSKELGIQCVIYNRRIWSSSYGSKGWRPYSGVSPHTDHAHVEQTWDSANNLTVARIQQVLGGSGGGGGGGGGGQTSNAAVIATQRAINLVGKEIDGFWGPQTERGVNTIRSAINGQFPFGVKEAQTRVGVATADGAWGPKSKAALTQTIRELQAAWGAGVDGQWGPNTEARWQANRAAYYRG